MANLVELTNFYINDYYSFIKSEIDLQCQLILTEMVKDRTYEEMVNDEVYQIIEYRYMMGFIPTLENVQNESIKKGGKKINQ